MKTQISSLINGSENTVRNLAAEKYKANPIGFYSCKNNVPQFGGTAIKERKEIAEKVSAENPNAINIIVNGIPLSLSRYNSVSGKTWRWETEITPEQYGAIVGKEAPAWNHKGAKNSYGIIINGDCTVEVYATSGKKGFNTVVGEEYITVL